MLPPIEEIRDHLMSTWLFFVNCGYDGMDPNILYPKDVRDLIFHSIRSHLGVSMLINCLSDRCRKPCVFSGRLYKTGGLVISFIMRKIFTWAGAEKQHLYLANH